MMGMTAPAPGEQTVAPHRFHDHLGYRAAWRVVVLLPSWESRFSTSFLDCRRDLARSALLRFPPQLAVHDGLRIVVAGNAVCHAFAFRATQNQDLLSAVHLDTFRLETMASTNKGRGADFYRSTTTFIPAPEHSHHCFMLDSSSWTLSANLLLYHGKVKLNCPCLSSLVRNVPFPTSIEVSVFFADVQTARLDSESRRSGSDKSEMRRSARGRGR